MRSKNFALIAAVADNMGIGIKDQLPWKLSKDMKYFERITKKISLNNDSNDINFENDNSIFQNAVVMGRKTWEAIPPKYKPLKDRLNIVLSKTIDNSGSTTHFVYPTLDAAIENLKNDPSISNIFVIGGSYAYKEAMESKNFSHILITRVYQNFECDTFFPTIDENVFGLASHDELESFVNEKVPKGRQEENGIEYEFLLYKRKNL
ncbi:23682_t:CDS:2 [Entrophospora sp. SA101]|nr:4826_t:CDS:2 [Entrophospora sp. SA101]CAJ0753520.1 12363_t:CDS:2 [Entrophospora sp. SA101]CAJ0754863.1 23682_t:CDS:2 [Entrophospora sp. SA101]CAJ0910380.1 12808_t:CDS:2 [Entrophospora sp. SA101]CAJ0914626.1 14368_t:CDS:2 [Entrophospora sp. SA101]